MLVDGSIVNQTLNTYLYTSLKFVLVHLPITNVELNKVIKQKLKYCLLFNYIGPIHLVKCSLNSNYKLLFYLN